MRAAIALLISSLATAPLVAQDPVPSPPTPFTAAEEARYLSLGAKYVGWFLNGHADSLLSVMTPEMAAASEGIDGLRQRMDMVGQRGGTLLKVVEQKMTRRRGLPQFWWAGSFSEMPNDDLVIRYILDEDGKISGAGLGPRSNTPPVDSE